MKGVPNRLEDEDALRLMYEGRGLSAEQIARETATSTYKVRTWLDRHGITEDRSPDDRDVDWEWLERKGVAELARRSDGDGHPMRNPRLLWRLLKRQNTSRGVIADAAGVKMSTLDEWLDEPWACGGGGDKTKYGELIDREMASEMLEEPGTSVSDVARRLGMRDVGRVHRWISEYRGEEDGEAQEAD
jgi:hypothetical protein